MNFTRFPTTAFVCGLSFMVLSGCQPNAATGPLAPQETAVSVVETALAPETAEVKSAAPPKKLLSDAELAEGWISLFDGETLFGWKPNSEANWRVEAGAIVVDSGPPGLLNTTAQFGDYVLRCDFRSAEGTNSGLFLHNPGKPTDPAKDCYELNIAPPNNPFPTCSLVKRAKAEGNFESRDWQTFEVSITGDSVKIALNGKPSLDYTDPTPLRRGHVGLQLNQGRAEFRNIKLRPLTPTNLFNGKDLAGWKQFPEQASKFTVNSDGTMNVKNGRGQLETEQSFGDFALQIECISHAANLNSGVFFRCIPGEQMNGYECQIHNGFKDGDRTKPLDCGTGGFFRRQNARQVVANDLEWFHMTLVADGNHMSAWVNGHQVSDWTDNRPPHTNPRNGRRDEAGTIMLQGHDPTTDLSFKNLRVGTISARASTGP